MVSAYKAAAIPMKPAARPPYKYFAVGAAPLSEELDDESLSSLLSARVVSLPIRLLPKQPTQTYCCQQRRLRQ